MVVKNAVEDGCTGCPRKNSPLACCYSGANGLFFLGHPVCVTLFHMLVSNFHIHEFYAKKLTSIDTSLLLVEIFGLDLHISTYMMTMILTKLKVLGWWMDDLFIFVCLIIFNCQPKNKSLDQI